MTLPGLDQLARLSPDLARAAASLGHAAWTSPTRTARETTAAFLGADLALGLFDLPLTLHTTMARRRGVSDAYLADVITRLAPHVGYPHAAQALTTTVRPRTTADRSTPDDQPTQDAATDREMGFAVTAASRLLNATNPWPDAAAVDDILAEYGQLRAARPGS